MSPTRGQVNLELISELIARAELSNLADFRSTFDVCTPTKQVGVSHAGI